MHNALHYKDTTSSGISWEIVPHDSTSSHLKLSGDLKPGWLGKLFMFLSSEEINVVKGNAWKCSTLGWESCFEIEKNLRPIVSSGFNPMMAFNAIYKRGTDSQLLKISELKIKRSSHHGGSIYVEISGKDHIGFLNSILSVFSFYSLFPTELEITTTGHIASDQFWLKGIANSVPSDEDIKLLTERFNRFL